ncbi:MAG: hypothetical protein IJJ47_04590 [Methanosphaera sp.]|nr:hypothetical protein [Methanosphaera sp.]
MNTITDEYFVKQVNNMVEHFNTNMKTRKLFIVDIGWEELYKLYMDNIPNKINQVYRTNNEYECSACRHFFHKAANIIAMDEETYEYITLFGCEAVPELKEVYEILDKRIKEGLIRDIFLSESEILGTKEDKEILEDGTVIKHNHYYLDIPGELIGTHSEMMDARANRKVLESSTLNISLYAINTVLELIETDSLYRATEWKKVLLTFKEYLENHEKISISDKDIYYWIKSIELGPVISKIKNHSIGVLLTDITDGMPLEDAVNKYEKIVAPTNYKRPKPILTRQMIEKAQNKIEELGFADSIPRRYANPSDISINDILFANRNVKPELKKSEGIFDKLTKFIPHKTQNFDKIQEIKLNDFIENVLPKALEVELYLSYDLERNFVSLIAPVNPDAPSMFKWDNAFSWTYINNLADSLMKERVKAMGGDVDVDLRFTIQWNTGDWDKNDLDAHCTEPDGHEIYFSDMKSNTTGGWLDVDIINPKHHKPAVENIQYKHKTQMTKGEYLFRVHQYTYRGGDDGFSAEIEFDGRIFKFSYPFKLNHKEYVEVAKVILNDENEFELESIIDKQSSNKKQWNLTYNTFVPVSLICYSPNYWGKNSVGNKHVFFMLKDCVNDDRARPWFNEYLNNELYEHKRVTEALSSITKVEETDNQLSGVGFSLTQRNKITLKVKSQNIERMFNVII